MANEDSKSLVKSSLFKVKRSITDRFDKNLGEIDLAHFILTWTNNNPLDKLWREKHNIAFNSERHRSVKIIDLIIELAQVNVVNRITSSYQQKQKYVPNRGEFFKFTSKSSSLSQEEIEDAFNNIDIDAIESSTEDHIVL